MLVRRALLGALVSAHLALISSSVLRAEPPAAPTGLLATAVSSEQIALSWTDNSLNEKAFSIERSLSPTDGFKKIGKVPAGQTNYQSTQLAADTVYYYRVRSMKKKGHKSAYSNTSWARTAISGAGIVAPDIVTAAAVSCNQIDLSWSPTLAAGSGLASYRVFRDGVYVASTKATVFSATGLTPSTGANFTVAAVDTTGRISAPSRVVFEDTPVCSVNVPPMAKADVQATALDAGGVTTFDGAGSSDLDGSITRYTWNFGDGGAAQGAVVSHVFAAGTYAVTLTVEDDRGAHGADQTIVNIAALGGIPPVAPSGLTATASSPWQTTLIWTDNSSDEIVFKIERASDPSGPWTQIATLSVNSQIYINQWLSSSTSYSYRARAYGSGGYSAYSNIASVATPSNGGIPDPPVALFAVAASSSQIDLAWTDRSNQGTGFKIERSATGSGPWSLVSTTAANTRTFSSTGLTSATTYYFRVRSCNELGDSIASNTALATTQAGPSLPTAPMGLLASAVSATRVDLQWTDTSINRTGFRIERADDGTQTFTEVATTTSTSWSDSSVVPATAYFYRVRTYNDVGNSGYSNIVAATTPTAVTIPVAPTGLIAESVSTSQIHLTWSDNSTNESGFEIERAASSAGPFSWAATVTSSSWSDTGLGPLTTFFYRVRATNSAGPSGYSNMSGATTSSGMTIPAPPSNLSATAASSSRIDLAWTDNASDETGFRIETSTTPSGVWAPVASTPANVDSYSVSGMASSSTAYFRVRAFNSAGDSASSNIAGATTFDVAPNAPAGLTALAVSTSQISLSWVDTSSNESGFRIERASSPSGSFELIASRGAGSESFTDSGLTALTSYSYRVRAFNTTGESSFSNVASATTLEVGPAAPTGLSASAVSSSQINLSWIDASSNESGFRIERASSPTGPFESIATLGPDSTSYSNTGLATATSFSYRVLAFNAAGDSGYSNVARATTFDVSPAPPTGLTAQATSASQINLTWIDASSNETGFKIERGSASTGAFDLIATRGAGSTTYSDTGLSASTSYSYRVSASNASGDSAPSNVATVTTQGVSDTTPPTTPTGVRATSPVCGRIALSWNASTDMGGSGLRGYNIYRKNVFLKQVAAPSTTTLDIDLPPATFFYYTVIAIDNAGNPSTKSSVGGTLSQACAGTGGNYAWSKSFGGSQLEDSGIAVAVDAMGNVFVTGEFQGRADLGGGILTPTGYRDVFVAKYAPSGTLLWAKAFGGIYDDTGRAIAVDAQGDVFVAGLFPRTMDFGGSNLISAGGYDIFLAKLSGANGQHLWSKRIGGTGDDRADGVAVDSLGDVYITGQFKGVVDFGGGTVPNTSPYAQAYLAKYAGSDGAHMWSKRFGELNGSAMSTFASAQSVAIGADDAAVITGYFKGNVNFGTGALANAGNLDIFLAKFSAGGTPLWGKSFGDDSDQHAQGVAVDTANNIYVTGDFLGTIDLGAGPLPSTSNAQTIFLAGFASDGRSLWSKSFTAAGLNIGSYTYGIAVDLSSNIMITGSISGRVDFGGGPLPIVGTVFLAKFSATGGHLWSKAFSGQGGKGRGLAADASGNVILTGSYDLKIDLGDGDVRSSGGVGSDVFVLEVGP